uniref:Uncharacterized protein n=1 Tax=Nicotiana tabacum TaxID=4097 RepID=A0A1S4BLC4_TOBAC|nr:PREDICTED: uncharacterized protein LOC107809518 [Nicotiana tabacum]
MVETETMRIQSVTRGKRIRKEVSEDDITFIEVDVDELLLPHNDALVISLNGLDFKIKHVLVDPKTSANIIQWRVLEQATFTRNIIWATKLLAGFNLTSVMTRGEILFPTRLEGVKKTTLFEVVDGDMGYNIILRRPWIHEMKVVTSTYVFDTRRDQPNKRRPTDNEGDERNNLF